MNDLKCAQELPYPKVSISCPDRRYIPLIEELYAGKNGEQTALHQYSYQYIWLHDTDSELAEALSCISMCEMKHMELLAEVIKGLGGDPKYLVCNPGGGSRPRPMYWHGAYPSYAKTPRKMLLDDIAGEERAVRDYTAAAAAIENEEVSAVLRRIIMDEEKHIEILTAFYEKYK